MVVYHWILFVLYTILAARKEVYSFDIKNHKTAFHITGWLMAALVGITFSVFSVAMFKQTEYIHWSDIIELSIIDCTIYWWLYDMFINIFKKDPKIFRIGTGGLDRLLGQWIWIPKTFLLWLSIILVVTYINRL